MKAALLLTTLLTISLFAKEFTLNLIGSVPKENIKTTLNLELDQNNKLIPYQKFDLTKLDNFKSLKVISAPGLKGTLKDEREIIVYYKTNLDVAGLKIRNLYKVAVARIYDEEAVVDMRFDPDYYQNIVSFLKYHNIKKSDIDDLDNLYGTWEEI